MIETYHIGDRGHQDNVHELDDKKLKTRTVVPIDIAKIDTSIPLAIKSQYKPSLSNISSLIL